MPLTELKRNFQFLNKKSFKNHYFGSENIRVGGRGGDIHLLYTEIVFGVNLSKNSK